MPPLLPEGEMSPRGPGRVLGVDLGLQRTGLALSDELGITVRALENRIPQSRAADVAFLVELSRTWEVAHVVIGHPVMPRSGDEGPMARRARGFADALREAFEAAGWGHVQVLLADERGTSLRAAERLVAAGIRKSRRKAALDGEAARILVEEFLATGGAQG